MKFKLCARNGPQGYWAGVPVVAGMDGLAAGASLACTPAIARAAAVAFSSVPTAKIRCSEATGAV
ncbi:hypothetical protein D3C87_2090230 [compost metagenome]